MDVARQRHSKLAVEAAGERLDDVVLRMRREFLTVVRADRQNAHEDVEQLLRGLGASHIRHLWLTNAISATIDQRTLEALELHPSVTRVTRDATMGGMLHLTPEVLGAPVFWNEGHRGWGESVAVIDTGIDQHHPMFSGLNIEAKSFIGAGRDNPCALDDPDSPFDQDGHGTHVASIAAGRPTPYQLGSGVLRFSGVASDLGKLYALKAGQRVRREPDCKGGFSLSDILTALEWALVETPVAVVNLSLGSVDDEEAEWVYGSVIDYAAQVSGVTIVAAAGNSGTDAPVGCPACALNAIAVANTDTRGTLTRDDDRIADSSSRGPTRLGVRKPDLAAPGEAILAAKAGSSELVPLGGTSMAAPHIAGAVALLRNAGVRDALAIKGLLLNTTDHYGWRPDRGWGSANLERAFAWKDFVRVNQLSLLTPHARKLYRGSTNGALSATMVWNRQVDERGAWLNRLGLALFHTSTGALIRKSDTAGQNVQQVYSDGAGDFVLSVTRLSDPTNRAASESYGLSLSHAGFREVNGPEPTRRCTAPGEVSAGSRFEVTCEFGNVGDLPLSKIGAVVGAPGLSPATMEAAQISVGGKVVRTASLIAPAAAGNVTLSFSTVAELYGEVWELGQTAQVVRVVQPVPTVTLTSLRTASTVTTSSCAVPTAVNQFTVRDARVWTWFVVEGGQRGDRPTFEWFGPGGTVLRTMTLPALTANGNFCMWDYLDVAGTSIAQQLGLWSVRVSWNGVRVGQTSFSIATAKLSASRMTYQVTRTNLCTVPTPTTVFGISDTEAIVWFSIEEARANDQLLVVWWDPEWNEQRTWRFDPLSSGGNWCFSAALPIRGTTAATKPGTWNVGVYLNNRYFFGESFRLQ